MKWLKVIKLEIRKELNEMNEKRNQKKEFKRRWGQEKIKKEVNKYTLYYLWKVILLAFLVFYFVNIFLDVTIMNKIFGSHISQDIYLNNFIPYTTLVIVITLITTLPFNLPDEPVAKFKSFNNWFLQTIERILNRFVVIFCLLPFSIYIFYYFLNNLTNAIPIILLFIAYQLVKKIVHNQSNRVLDIYWETKPDEEFVFLEKNRSTTVHTPDVSLTSYSGRLIKEVAVPVKIKEEKNESI